VPEDLVASPDQLTLPIALDDRRARLPQRMPLMAATERSGLFDDERVFFEPWWPGARMVAFWDGTSVRLQTEHLADPLASFPELADLPDQLVADGIILDGTLMVLDDEGRPDPELLRLRLAGRLAPAGEAAFVVSDLLYERGAPITALAFERRRARLREVLVDGEQCVAARGVRGEGETLASAVASLGLGSISARRLDARWVPGPAGDAWLRIPVEGVPARETRPLLVLLQRLPLEG
jgi:bifunctional non-homologous end joining protein LigD